LQETVLITDASKRELITRGTPLFPCGIYLADITQYVTGDIPWHWHEDIEMVVVYSGSIYVNLGDIAFTLKQGEGIFINTNVLHSMQIVGDNGCILISFVFPVFLISGMPGSIIEQKYIRPILDCRTLSGVLLSGEQEWHNFVIDHIRNAYMLYESNGFGYEILVCSELSKAWYYLAKNLQPVIKNQHTVENVDTVRIKKMLDFIHENYNEPLEPQQIANIVNLSERQCFRCFKNRLGMSPVVYLMKYRVLAAAGMLATTDMPVTEICSRSGFNTPSYFAKVFKQFMKCSPTSYRQLNKNGC
jgi:AraC-type DNA-binding domain-containing proteins